MIRTRKNNKSAGRPRRAQRQRSASKRKIRRGGRAVIPNPLIKYTKGSALAKHLSCPKCNGKDFIVKTLTMGTKLKSFFGAEILDNRFKVFTCSGCGFVQTYSNNITCDGKNCDPIF